MALRYLFIVGGREFLIKNKLSRHIPKWLGEREDLTTVGGRKSKSQKSWKDSGNCLWPTEKKMIVACLMEAMVHVVMTTHCYFFGGKFYLQRDSGPIGLRIAAMIEMYIFITDPDHI